jgi:hypothetical protein
MLGGLCGAKGPHDVVGDAGGRDAGGGQVKMYHCAEAHRAPLLASTACFSTVQTLHHWHFKARRIYS